MNSSINKDNIRQTIEHLSSFTNRYYTTNSGLEAAKWIKSEFERYIQESQRKDASVEFFSHSFKQPSVIAKIQGTSNERIIIGAHEDSIVSGGVSETTRAPGADDDASGTSTVLEVFRVLVSDPTFVPTKTLEFHTYAAEEVGLRGSQDVAASYRSKNVIVKAMLQFDMTGYKNGKPAFVTDYVNSALTSSISSLASRYTNIEWTTTTCGYGCSDHASWNKYSYPSAFPFESIFKNSNSKIHTKDDLIKNLDLDQAREFAALGVAFMLEYSK